MSLFGAHKVSKGTVEEISHMVEQLFKDRKLNAHNQQVEETAGYGWWLNEGKAKVYIFVQETQTGPVLRVTTPILLCPNSNLEQFYRKLLDTNIDLSSCAFATHQNTVLVVAQRHTLALDQEELDEIVENVAYVANVMSEKLAAEFKAPPYSSQ